MDKIGSIESRNMKTKLPSFNVGDTVDVHFTVKEENKQRIQVFTGIVIAKRGSGISTNFTVRRISYGEGVERIFPIHSPLIEMIKVKKKGKVRRAKLYYLRGRRGKKATKVKEKIEHKK